MKKGFCFLVILVCASLLFAAGVAEVSQSAGKLGQNLYSAVSTDVMYESRGVMIPATVVYPESNVNENFPLVVVVHGHGGGRQENGGFGLIAERLASAGIVSIRMDFPGCGDSTESFIQNNLTNMLSDIHAARAFAIENYDMIDESRIGILGYSMGGRLAIHSSYLNQGMWGAMALLAPSADKGDYANFLGGYDVFHERMSIAEAEGSYVFTTPWGQQQILGLQFYEDMKASDPMNLIKVYKGPVFAVVGTADTTIPRVLVEELIDNTESAASAELYIVEEATHGYGFYSDRKDLSLEVANAFTDFFISQF